MAGKYRGRKPVDYEPQSRGHQAFLRVTPGRVARTIGVPAYTVTEWRQGKVRPRPEILVRIGAAFEIPPLWWDEPVPPPPVERVVSEAVTAEYARRAPPERELPDAPWDFVPPGTVEGEASSLTDPLDAPSEAGIRGILWTIGQLAHEFAISADPVLRQRLLSSLTSANERLAKLQRQQPIDADHDAGPGHLNCSHPWVRTLDYEHQALFESVHRLLEWHREHPDQRPLAVPATAPRLCVVDQMRGSSLGVLSPEGYVTLIAPTELDEATLKALLDAGWEPPVRRKELYEHQTTP